MQAPPPRPPAPPPVPYESEAELVRAHLRMWRFAARNRHVTIPLIVPVGMLAAGAVLAGEHATFEAGVIGAAASVTTWFTAPSKWSPEPRIKDWRWTSEIAYARSTVGGGTLWLFLAAIFGPGQTWLEVMLGALCAAWGGLFWWHKRPRDKRARRRHERRVRDLNMWWQMHAPGWGAGGSGITDVRDHDGMESWLVQLWGGKQTIGTIKALIPLLESALAGYVHHGMSRPELNKANPSQVWIHLKREDPLREAIEWDDSMASGDITDPAALGVKETGGWLRESLRSGFFILGRTRWGKSNQLSVMLAKATKCRNARILLIDMKGGRAARPWLAGVDWVATTMDEVRIALACMRAEAKARAAYAYNGEEQLEPTEDVPTWIVVIDETYEVTSESAGDAQCAAMLATIASQGQGVEVYPWVLSQYGGLAETVRTEQTRSNLNSRMCFQTEAQEHGTFALGEDARRGIDTTKIAVKGGFYFRRDSKTAPEQVRGPEFPHALAKATARRNAELTERHSRPVRLYCGAQPIAAGDGPVPTWQQVFDARWDRLPAEFRRDAPQASSLDNPAPPEDDVTPANKISMRPVHPEAERINAEVDEDPDVSDEDIRRAREMAAARGEPVDLRSEPGPAARAGSRSCCSPPRPEGSPRPSSSSGSGPVGVLGASPAGKLADQGSGDEG